VAGLLNTTGTFRIHGKGQNRITFGEGGTSISNPYGQTIGEAYDWLWNFASGVEVALRAVAKGEAEARVDQFDNPVPSDLVLLDVNPADLSAAEVRAIDQIAWYHAQENRGMVLVSLAAVRECLQDPDGHEFATLQDVNIYLLDTNSVKYIHPNRHRWSDEAGFHHS